MKCGKYETVFTHAENFLFLISLIRSASIIGAGKPNKIEYPLILIVLRIRILKLAFVKKS